MVIWFLYIKDIAKIKVDIKKKTWASFLSHGTFNVMDGKKIINQAAVFAESTNPKFRHAEAINAGVMEKIKQFNKIGSNGYWPKIV